MSDPAETAEPLGSGEPPGADEPLHSGQPLGAGDPLGPAVRSLFADLSLAGDAMAGNAAERVLCGEAGRVEHGTRVRFSLRMAGERVREAHYRAYGCPYTLACCEWLARRLCDVQLSGQTGAGPAERLTATVGIPARWAAALGIPQARLGRLLVIEDALRAAIAADRP